MTEITCPACREIMKIKPKKKEIELFKIIKTIINRYRTCSMPIEVDEVDNSVTCCVYRFTDLIKE